MYKVGDIVKLKVGCLGNDAEVKGVCYENYCIGFGEGASFIFENGNYDGFSSGEQKDMLEYVGESEKIKNYRFRNVIALDTDFQRGFFDEAFK